MTKADSTTIFKFLDAKLLVNRVRPSPSLLLAHNTTLANPYNFRHYDLSYFALNVNGEQIPTEGLPLGFEHENSSIMGYRTPFEGSGIHDSNSGLQITHDMYIRGFFMLFFDLTPDRGASERHTSHPDNGNIRVELKFTKPLPEPITCIFYLEHDNSVRIDNSPTVSTDFQKSYIMEYCLFFDRHSVSNQNTVWNISQEGISGDYVVFFVC